MGLHTPIAMILFNRPRLTQRVFERVRTAQPTHLLLAADGPRADKPGESALCAEVRSIAGKVDWPCKVETRFSSENQGCRLGVSSGIDWVFERCERAIILEDDCLPDESFFGFAERMLDVYADDPRIMMVTGFNPLGQWHSDRQDYHFANCGSIWGWASWRRAWQHYDVNMSAWDDETLRQRFRDALALPEIYEPRESAYDKVRRGLVNTWDYQWTLARLLQSGLSIVPAVNLVQNIGFDAQATHTHATPHWAMAPVQRLTLPVRTASYVAIDRQYDLAFTRLVMGR